MHNAAKDSRKISYLYVPSPLYPGTHWVNFIKEDLLFFSISIEKKGMNMAMRKRTVFVIILALLVLGISVPGIALAETTATFTGLGAGESIYTRYYSRYTPAQVFKMQIGSTTYDGFCIDLFHTISFGDILVVNGPLSEDIRDQVDWCAVNYILNTYASSSLSNLEAASIQAALWYLTTEPYGPYTGLGGPYQFMSDPTTTTPYDAYRQSGTPRDAVRARAFQILNSVPRDNEGDCTFRFPVNVTLTPVVQNTPPGGTASLIATVYDQHRDPLEGISVNFYHDSSGTLNLTTATTNAAGQIPLKFTAPAGYGHAHIMADVRGNYGTLLYDPGRNRQSVTTISLLPGSISANASVFWQTIPSIKVEKLISTDNVSFTHADTIPISVLQGYPVYYKFVITNDGNVNLANFKLDDTLYAPLPCTPPDLLQPGELFTCYYGPVTAVLGTQCNTFTANATPQGGGDIVEDNDRACYDPSPTYKKSGIVYYDNNGNGKQDPGEPGIPDITLWLCTNCGNTYPCSTINITRTSASGYYEFPLLTPGPYVVSIPAITDGDTTDFNEQLYAMANPVLVPPVVYSDDPVPRTCIFFNVTGEDHPDNNFGFFRWLYVSGYKYLDANKDGKRDPGEQGLQDFTIRVYNETQLYGSAVTSPAGYYQLLIRDPGNYTVNEVQKTDWKQTEPASGKLEFIAKAATNVTQNFGNYPVVNPCSCPTQAIFAYSVFSTPLHTIQFTDKSTGYPVSWLWKFGDGKYSTSQNPKHAYSKKGSYRVTLAVMSYDCAGKSRWSYYTKTISVP